MNIYISLERILKKILKTGEKSNFVVAIDTANGATSVIAEKVFTALGN